MLEEAMKEFIHFEESWLTLIEHIIKLSISNTYLWILMFYGYF